MSTSNVTNPRASRRPKRGVLARLRNYLVAGALVSVPAYVTFWVFYRFFLSLRGVLHLFPESWVIRDINIRELLISIPGVGAIITVVCVVAVGALATNFVGRRIIRLSEKIIAHVPILSTIYQSVKQLMVTVFRGDSSRFDDVVYLEYPRRGMWSIGFVTGDTYAAARDKIGTNCVNVFVPTTPNPTSGFYLIVPEEDVIRAEITVEQAFKLIMSAGLVNPDSEDARLSDLPA